VSRETYFFERTAVHAAGLLAYPFSKTRRVEF
jgi:hypothetical protein